VTAGKAEKLVRMANQIGDFYAAMPEKEAAEGAVSHLRHYWTPKMIRELIAFAEEGRSGLNPTAAHAVEALKRAAHA
jgi:formate dehydrogenase subunit delta